MLQKKLKQKYNFQNIFLVFNLASILSQCLNDVLIYYHICVAHNLASIQRWHLKFLFQITEFRCLIRGMFIHMPYYFKKNKQTVKVVYKIEEIYPRYMYAISFKLRKISTHIKVKHSLVYTSFDLTAWKGTCPSNKGSDGIWSFLQIPFKWGSLTFKTIMLC